MADEYDLIDTDELDETSVQIQAMNQELVQRAFNQLRPNCQEIIQFYYQHELPVAKLAERMKLTPESARNQLYRCRTYFKSYYEALRGQRA